MHIVLVMNPKSGRGHAIKAAMALKSMLEARTHRVTVLDMQSKSSILESAIVSARRVVILGGDGTVHHLLPLLAKAQTPMYHMGFGTANLIAKSFSMEKTPKRVADDLELDHPPMQIDLPTCNGHPFLIMVSMGIDASVIHRFEESRTLRGGYRAYISPILRELVSPRPARFRIETDPPAPADESDPITGVLVVANLRAYGGGFNPCPDANPSDAQLDAVAIPCTTTLGVGLNYGLLRLRRSSRTMRRQTANTFTITASEHSPGYVQIDGEKASSIPGLPHGILEPGAQLHFAMSEHKINVHANPSHSPACKVR